MELEKTDIRAGGRARLVGISMCSQVVPQRLEAKHQDARIKEAAAVHPKAVLVPKASLHRSLASDGGEFDVA